MLRVCFVIRSLDRGGAERQLVELVKRLDPSRFQVSVLTFYSGGSFEQELKGGPVELVPLQKRGRWDLAGFARRARAAVAVRQPDIVHGYLGIANEFAWGLGRLSNARVVWGIRSSFLDFSHYDWSFTATFRGGALLSRFVDLVIYNSQAGCRHYRAHGYRPRREVVIPNGIDLTHFQFDAEGRRRVRTEWDIGPGEKLVGLVGRADPMKHTALFLDVAKQLRSIGRGWRFVCVGDASSDYARELRASPVARELGPAVVWAGARADMPAVYSALDTLVLSSRGEGFPNVVAEAMACEVVCVTTDVGDAAAIVGSTGWVVPSGDAAAMVDACITASAEPESARTARGRAARQRVADQFSVEQLADRTARVLSEIAR